VEKWALERRWRQVVQRREFICCIASPKKRIEEHQISESTTPLHNII